MQWSGRQADRLDCWVSKYIEQADRQAAEVLTAAAAPYTRPETAQQQRQSFFAPSPRGLTAAQTSSADALSTILRLLLLLATTALARSVYTCYTPRDLMSDQVIVLASHHDTQWSPP